MTYIATVGRKAANPSFNLTFSGWLRQPPNASYRTQTEHFDSSKEAYVWLIQQFITAFPSLFADINWQTAFVIEGDRRNYFGRNPREMFFTSEHLADDPNNYAELANGWYVNLNLSNPRKFQPLCKFSAVAKFSHGSEWHWKVEVDPDTPEHLGDVF